MMINLKQNLTQLTNLDVTINAIRNLNALIKFYSEDKPGSAYLTTRWGPRGVGSGEIEFQMNRNIIVPALVAQRQTLVNSLAKLGIDAEDFTET